jgi:hypothetical protein
MKISTRSFAHTALTVAACALAGAAHATVVYDSTRQTPLPPNVSSQAYQAQQVSEFGDHVILAGTQRQLTTVTMTMSNWAYQSIYLSDPRYGGANQNNAGFFHNLTANLYGVDHSTATPGVGAPSPAPLVVPSRRVAPTPMRREAAAGTVWLLT